VPKQSHRKQSEMGCVEARERRVTEGGEGGGGVRGKVRLKRMTEAMTPAPRPNPVFTTALEKQMSHYRTISFALIRIRKQDTKEEGIFLGVGAQ
jgi:hypothetical protein